MITSINPYTSEKVFEIREFNDDEIQKALDKADEQYKSWKETSFAERAALMKSVGDELRKNVENYAAKLLRRRVTATAREDGSLVWNMSRNS